MAQQGNRSRTPATAIQPQLLSAGELGRLLGVSRRTVWRLLSTGQLVEPLRLGGSVRWRLDEVQAWINNGCPPTRS